MISLFNDITLTHYQDQVSVADGRKAMSDDEAGTTLHQVVHGILDEDLGASIYRAGSLIEDQHGRITNDGPGDG